MESVFLVSGETYPNIHHIINKSSYIIPSTQNRIYLNFRGKKYILKNEDGINIEPTELKKFNEDFPSIKINKAFCEGTITEKFIPSYQFIPPFPQK